jgi:hypothetical protein
VAVANEVCGYDVRIVRVDICIQAKSKVLIIFM